IGEPRELYDRPANEFVMTFFGPVVHLDEGPVRPHDLGLSLVPEPESIEAMVSRVVHLGFEVRVDLVDGEGHAFSAQLTRDETLELELEAGQIVYVTARNGAASVEPPSVAVGD